MLYKKDYTAPVKLAKEKSVVDAAEALVKTEIDKLGNELPEADSDVLDMAQELTFLSRQECKAILDAVKLERAPVVVEEPVTIKAEKK